VTGVHEYLEAARAQIGRVLAIKTGTVYAKEFQRWAAAVGDLNPLYFDPEFAGAHGHPDVVMPPMFISKVTNGVSFLADLRPDGLDRREELDVPMPPRRMAGGEEYEFDLPVYPAEEIALTRTLFDVSAKSGRSGEFIVFTLQDEYVGRDGLPLGRMRRRVIAR
jgi:acyl dehydratase